MKAFTDIEQSKKLAEMLPLESADMWFANGIVVARDSVNEPDDIKSVIPCWSIAALLDVLPKINGLKPILDLEENSIQYSGNDLYVVAYNLIDACVEMIIKLHEQKLL